MRRTTIIMMTLMVLNGAAQAEAFWKKKKDASLDRAEKYYAEREYYLARVAVTEAIKKNPADKKAQKLMGKILDKEIERQKEQVYPLAVEEMNQDQKKDEIKTWLERSQALFARKEYDLALFAAEKTFIFDPDNRQASELIDKIKEQAIKDGKADMLFLGKMYKEEVSDRLQKYRSQARALANEGHFGQARYTAEKILLLEPEDPEGLKLYQSILEQEGALRHET